MKLADAFRKIFGRYPDDAVAQHLHGKFNELPITRLDGAPGRILVQAVETSYYYALFTHLCLALRQRAPLTIDLFLSRSFNAGIGNGLRQFLVRSFPLNRLLANQWLRLYDRVSDHVGYRSHSLRHPLGDLIDAFRAWRDWRALRAAGQLESLVIEGVEVADLVSDSYLRFRPSPRVRLDDPFLVSLLWQARRDLRRSRIYFRKARPQFYLTSFTTYVQHGVAARVALQEGVKVFSFGNFQHFYKLITPADVYHTQNPVNYRRDFEHLPDAERLMQDAQRQLELRLSGGIDVATSYMKASAYKNVTAAVPDVRGAVVIFLHDFYDSPHVYADLVFPDFWQWVCFTLETLRGQGIRVFAKPHPNQIALSDHVLEELKQRYPDLAMIPSGVTNRQLVDAGMVCAVTVYGTVAHEMAYLGVPTIACARHPHVAFDFCRTAKDRETYAGYLRNALKLGGDPAEMRRQALQFYVMHNLSLPQDERDLRDAMIAAWKACLPGQATLEEISQRFAQMAALPAFAKVADDLVSKLAPQAAAWGQPDAKHSAKPGHKEAA